MLAETLRLLVSVLMEMPGVANVVLFLDISGHCIFSCISHRPTIHMLTDVEIAIASYYPDGSRDSLQHRFRGILAEGHRLREAGCEASAVRVFVITPTASLSRGPC